MDGANATETNCIEFHFQSGQKNNFSARLSALESVEPYVKVIYKMQLDSKTV